MSCAFYILLLIVHNTGYNQYSARCKTVFAMVEIKLFSAFFIKLRECTQFMWPGVVNSHRRPRKKYNPPPKSTQKKVRSPLNQFEKKYNPPLNRLEKKVYPPNGTWPFKKRSYMFLCMLLCESLL